MKQTLKLFPKLLNVNFFKTQLHENIFVHQISYFQRYLSEINIFIIRIFGWRKLNLLTTNFGHVSESVLADLTNLLK